MNENDKNERMRPLFPRQWIALKISWQQRRWVESSFSRIFSNRRDVNLKFTSLLSWSNFSHGLHIISRTPINRWKCVRVNGHNWRKLGVVLFVWCVWWFTPGLPVPSSPFGAQNPFAPVSNNTHCATTSPRHQINIPRRRTSSAGCVQRHRWENFGGSVNQRWESSCAGRRCSQLILSRKPALQSRRQSGRSLCQSSSLLSAILTPTFTLKQTNNFYARIFTAFLKATAAHEALNKQR